MCGGDAPVERQVVVFQPSLGVIENAAEGALLIQVDQRHRKFNDFEPRLGGLNPNFQRHGVARFGDVQVLQSIDAVALEAAEGVGETEPQPAIQFGGDLLVNPPPLFGRGGVPGKGMQITAAGDDVDSLFAGIEKEGDSLGLVLAIAVDGDQLLVPVPLGVFKRAHQSRAIPPVFLVRDDVDIFSRL